MGRKTGIDWTDHTFNPWWGCTKVSPACDNCYAEGVAHRFGTVWGAGQARRTFGDKHWREPELWDKAAALHGTPRRVFCASMADVFDNEVPQAWRDRLWALIERTPNLRWQLLTKRIGNVAKMIPERWANGLPPNVWLGITVVNPEEYARDVWKLLAINCAVHFLSMEPLLAQVDLACVPRHEPGDGWTFFDNPLTGFRAHKCGGIHGNKVDWVIVGGESGKEARPMQADWVRAMRDQCLAAGVPFFFKQWGEWAPNWLNDDAGQKIPGSEWMDRQGKLIAGDTLDGAAWKQFPEA